MLRSVKDLESYTLRATDGDIGTVANFLFDDEKWAIRYLVAETSGFFGGRRVLISPISFGHADWAAHQFNVDLTMDKVKNSPAVEEDKPVSRRHEEDFYRYYGYPHYWGYAGLWGMDAYPTALAACTRNEAAAVRPDDSGDVHLRSAKEVTGYHIQGTDESIGHVADFIVDDRSWEVRYLVIDTSNWWFGKKVLVAPHWASSISWDERKVCVGMSRQAIKSSPEWLSAAAVNREYETRLYDYFGRPVYWDDAS